MVKNPGPFPPADLPTSPDGGKVYHLDVKPGDIAPDIIVVGDPDRTTTLADEYLEPDYFTHEHRGLRTVTGKTKDTGQYVSFVTHGMGTPSADIIFGELIILNELIWETKKRKETWDQINIIRLGTSGGLREETQLGSALITKYVVGLDAAGLYYSAAISDDCCPQLERLVENAINDATPSGERHEGKFHPYSAKATQSVVDALERAAGKYDVDYKKGITVSCPGFWAAQGRDIFRTRPTVPDLDRMFAELNPEIDGLRFENMEMEASILIYLMADQGYNVGCICPAVNNRREGIWDDNHEENLMTAGKVALGALYDLRQQQTD